jgi:hypothetical protein
MSDIQARLAAINAKMQAEHTKAYDAVGKAIVVIWMFVAVFFGFALAEPQIKKADLKCQEACYVRR